MGSASDKCVSKSKMNKRIKKDLKKSKTTCILHWNYRKEQVFPEEIRMYGTHLADIYLKGNFIPSVPKWIMELKILNQLHLSENRLEELPEEITTLESLTNLSIDRNYLSSFPPNFFKLLNLVFLNASGNKFKFLPEDIGRMKSLMHLDVSENSLTELPESIGYLTNLEELLVDNNTLLTLTKSILYLPCLSYLRIHENEFLYLPIVPFLSSPRIYSMDCDVILYEPELDDFSSKSCNSRIKIFTEKIWEGTLLQVHNDRIFKSLRLPFHHIIIEPNFYPASLFELALRVSYEICCSDRTEYEIDNEFYNILPRNLQNVIRIGPNAYCSCCKKPIFDYVLIRFVVFCQWRQTVRCYCNTDCTKPCRRNFFARPLRFALPQF